MRPPARLGVRDSIPGSRVGLIDVAEKPEGEAAHAVGRDHRVDPVRLVANLHGLPADVLQNAGETPGGQPELPLPELAPAEGELGTNTELRRLLTLGNARELAGGLVCRAEVGADDLRIPDGMHDLEELALVPHSLAERAGAVVVGPHGRGAIATREMERHTEEQAKLELTLVALGRVGHAFERPEPKLGTRNDFMRCQALLGARCTDGQVLSRSHGVAAALEVYGELGGDLGQALARCRFERFGDGQMQSLAP